MIKLPNGCHCSDPQISPKNWNQLKELKGPWRLTYRFYDPAHRDQNGKIKPYQVNLKTINVAKTLSDRKKIAAFALRDEMAELLQGYNPRLKKTISPTHTKFDIQPTSLFLDALRMALERLKMEPTTIKEIRSYIIPNVSRAAVALGYFTLTISEVRRRHIVYILDWLREHSERFSDNTFNHYRTYLGSLFAELLEIEAVESNIINDIKKKHWKPKDRETLTEQERIYVNNLLLEKYPSFHRFLHIFFHSGARITELLALRGQDVELDGQRFRSVIKKGKGRRTEWRPIKSIAMLHWRQALEGCAPEDYVFSEDLVPGEKQIPAKQITRRWYSRIKKEYVHEKGKKGKYIDRIHVIQGREVKITADFYALKHLNTTEMVDHVGEQAAAELNQHTSTAMVVKIYDKNQKTRQHDKIKRVNNPFVPVKKVN